FVQAEDGIRCLTVTGVQTCALPICATQSFCADKKIVLVAGGPSHGKGEHEFRAGCLLLKSCLDKVRGMSSVVYSNGWPQDPLARSEERRVGIDCRSRSWA